MSVETKGKIYNGIIIFCVVVCVLLIGQVASDELFGGRKAGEHQPPAISQKSEGQNGTDSTEAFRLSEEYLESEIGRYLPEGLPLEDISVEIEQSGRICLSAEASKSGLKDFLSQSGADIKGLGLLPGKIELSLSAAASCDEESGMISISPESVTAGSVELDLSNMGQDPFSWVSEGINKMLLESGVSFKTIDFEDGCILLMP